jgi:CHAD domain-containing protein
MNGSYQLLAARYVRRQTRQLIGQLDGVRKADDVEFIHRARVSSRRLRAALRIFSGCFGEKKVKRWRKEVRQLTQGLGAARDKDVQIEFVRGVLAGLEDASHRAGIARLVLRLEQSRRALQPKAVEAVDRLQASGVAEEMLAASKRMLSKLKRRELSPVSPFSARRAEKQIVKCLNRFLEYEDCLASPEDGQQHHAMRIAAKRLRYTMEICSPVYEGGLGEFIHSVKQVQSLLGDIHDCDVWVEEIEEFVEDERERTIAYLGHTRQFGRLKIGLDYLRGERERRRQEGFEELVDFWGDLDREKAWERLVGTLKSQPGADSDGRTGNRQPTLSRAGGPGEGES